MEGSQLKIETNEHEVTNSNVHLSSGTINLTNEDGIGLSDFPDLFCSSFNLLYNEALKSSVVVWQYLFSNDCNQTETNANHNVDDNGDIEMESIVDTTFGSDAFYQDDAESNKETLSSNRTDFSNLYLSVHDYGQPGVI
jgi:hypothetical protein